MRATSESSRSSGIWLPAFASTFALWASFAPLDLWPLAWIAPLGWLWICVQPEMPGRRPWLSLWASGFVFWLLHLHFLRLPHPATSIGWVAISFYLAFYIPAFVWLARRAIHRWRVPLVVAAPVVWTGLELARGHLLTGLTYGSLGYSQYRWLALIQVADLSAVYGVSFFVMLGAAAIATLAFTNESRRWGKALSATGAIGLCLLYGAWRMSDRGEIRPGPKVALIQGSIDSQMKTDPNKRFAVHEEYMRLSRQAVREHPDVELLVWPETMFRESLVTYDDDLEPKPGEDWKPEDARYTAQLRQEFLADTARELGVPAIIGVDLHHYGKQKSNHFNCAILIEPSGAMLGRYEKTHRVMFGEYIPFGEWIPWVYQITPLAASLTKGHGPESFALGKFRLAPNICFENILPHVIRRQNAALAQRGEEPDILVNLTNEGWFWGSSELDLHLACSVLRAVEMRKPFLVAANTGFSASVDSNGRIVARGPRRATGVVYDQVQLDERRSLYARWGALPAALCLAFCVFLVGDSIVERIRQRRAARAAA